MKKNTKGVDHRKIKNILDKNKAKIELSMKACAHCSMCAESCFLFQARNKDPRYMPSYKFLKTLGVIYKKKGKVDRVTLEEMKPILWKRCVLCTRCYCPMGIDIPYLIRTARSICRSQDVYYRYDEDA
ncbi:MAG: DNA-binding protein [Desulfococcus sp. 4484_241]|nr:MAG: DNA-binding protein [Desulfococcus sp. 4484_241]